MPPSRQYDDPCGIARALNVVGDRWALLTVRELLLGAKRFGQLRAGLPGVSPNVLAQRLRELEVAGVVSHDQLPPPADVPVYALTQRGSALRPILIEMGRWGSQEPVASSHELSADALLVALLTTFVGDSAIEATYALQLDSEWFTIDVHAATTGAGTPANIDIVRARPHSATTTFVADRTPFREFVFGRITLDAAETRGVAVTGNRTRARQFPRLFAVSPPNPRPNPRPNPGLNPGSSLFHPAGDSPKFPVDQANL